MNTRRKTILSFLICLSVILTACSEKGEATQTSVRTSLLTEVAQTVAVQLTSSAPAVTPTSQPATPTLAATTTTAAVTVIPTAATGPKATAVVASTSWYGTICDVALFVSDDTIPDGTVLGPGVAFTKTWTLKNAGFCDWTDSYKLVYVSGNQMGAKAEYQLTDATIEPGATISISVSMIAPTTAGTYTGYWTLQNAAGANFGIGPANSKFYLNIVVSSSATTTKTPTPTITSTPTSTTAVTATTASTATFTPTTPPTAVPSDTPIPPTDTPVPADTPVTPESGSGG